MKLALYIARHYLISRKSSQAINLITWVVAFGIGISAAAVILVLSVFNGLTGFIEEMFASADPDLKVVAAQGRFFEDRDSLYQHVLAHPEVDTVVRSIEGRVMFQFVEKQTFGYLKGVTPSFLEVNPIDTSVYVGSFDLAPIEGRHQVIMGSAIADRLNAELENTAQPISVLYLAEDISFDITSGINTDFIVPAGFFSIQREYDEKYVFADLNFARRLFGLVTDKPQVDEDSLTLEELLSQPVERETLPYLSAYEIQLADLKKAERVKEDLEALLGPEYNILTWYQQHSTLYRVMKNEKLISYLILTLMLALVAVNVVGCLSVIVLEKSKDIATLQAMGATPSFIRQVFVLTGLLVGLIGGAMGVLGAWVIGMGQKYYGWLEPSGAESFKLKAFPVELYLSDFLIVFFTVVTLAGVASIYPASQAAKLQIAEGLKEE